MFGLNVFVQPDGVGRVDATREDSYNIPFRKTDAKYKYKLEKKKLKAQKKAAK